MTESTLLGLAAVLTALGGLVSVILAFRKARSDETEECLQRLKAAREAEERLASELHELKMERFRERFRRHEHDEG
jgi:hypothetical protein